MKRIYFVVEGPHDLEVVGRFLRLRGLERVRLFDELDAYWVNIVPRVFPHKGDLLRRVPVPVFYSGQGVSVAIHSAGGTNKIAPIAESTLGVLEQPPEGFGVLLDADDKAPVTQWQAIANSIALDFGEGPGHVSAGNPRAGIYVLPDNNAQGTLEHLLLECANKAYPTLLAAAKAWIDGLDPADKTVFINAVEREDFAKPAGKSKAIASCIASVLRPGKSIQVSIQDNQWFRHAHALELDTIRRLRSFIDRVVDGEKAETYTRLTA